MNQDIKHVEAECCKADGSQNTEDDHVPCWILLIQSMCLFVFDQSINYQSGKEQRGNNIRPEDRSADIVNLVVHCKPSETDCARFA